MKKSLAVLILLLIPINSFGYWVASHREMAKKAIALSNIGAYLSSYMNISQRDEFNHKTASKWIEDGSEWEDNSTRWLAHFYDPTTGKGLWGSAVPSIIWGKDYYENVWSWAKARDYYYTALTHTDTTVRQTNYAYLFRSLGQVIHLIHDKAVPAHVRNDGHTFGDPYERFVNGRINDANAPLTLDGYLPVYSSADTSTFSQFGLFWKNNSKGLAEFTNRNFVSRDTNFDDSSYQDYLTPVKTGESIVTETVTDPVDGVMQVEVRYIKGSVSDNYRPELSIEIGRLAAFSYFDYNINQYDSIFGRVYSLNNSVHKEYAKFLLPRAVGYSAGLLDYFFRGDIEITLPDNGVYAIMAPNGSFQEIRIKAKNKTATEEDMTNGEIKLVVKYKLAQADPFQSVPVDVSPDFYYAVGTAKNNANAVPKDDSTELAFDFSANPIPLWATDAYLQVVYKGKLGNEEGAVAVGFKDISEPTPIDIMNGMDHICINGSYMETGTNDAIGAVDFDADGDPEWDVFAHSLANNYVAFSPVTDPRTASASTYNALFTSIPPANYGRVYILTDYEFNLSNKTAIYNTDSRDTWVTWTDTTLYLAKGLKNQTDTINGEQIRTYPLMPNERGVKWWNAINYVNEEYPLGSECVTADAQPNFTGPVGVTIP